MPVIEGRTCPVCQGEFDEFGRRVTCEHCNNQGGVYEYPEVETRMIETDPEISNN